MLALSCIILPFMMENKTVPELFSDFYRLQNNDQEPSDAHLKVLDKVLRELEETP